MLHAAYGNHYVGEVVQQIDGVVDSSSIYNINIMLVCLLHEAVDDGLAVLRFGKHTFVGLNDKGHTVVFKPCIGILWGELLEEAFQKGCSARICLTEVANGCEGVGAVAATATRDGYLRQHFVLLFEDSHISSRRQFFEPYGAEESCCSSTYDGNLLIQLKVKNEKLKMKFS